MPPRIPKWSLKSDPYTPRAAFTVPLAWFHYYGHQVQDSASLEQDWEQSGSKIVFKPVCCMYNFCDRLHVKNSLVSHATD